MSEVKCLPVGPLAEGAVLMRLVEECDAALIVELRNTVKASILPKGATRVEDQVAWIRKYKEREALGQERYFTITLVTDIVGFVRIYDIDIQRKTFSWGSWVIREGTPAYVALQVAKLIYDFAFLTCGLSEALFDVRMNNPNVQRFHRRSGAKEIRRTDQDVYFSYSLLDYQAYRDQLSRTIVSLIPAP